MGALPGPAQPLLYLYALALFALPDHVQRFGDRLLQRRRHEALYHALTQAAKGMAWEAEIIRMLQRIRDEERRRRAREWRG